MYCLSLKSVIPQNTHTHTHTRARAKRQVKTATPVVQMQMAALCNGAGLVCIIFIIPNVCDMNERTERTVQLHCMFNFKIPLFTY